MPLCSSIKCYYYLCCSIYNEICALEILFAHLLLAMGSII